MRIDPRELSFSFVRSSGPGGQNVNKVASRVVLRFNVRESASLTPEQKARIRRRLGRRVSHAGIITVTSQVHRTQQANRRRATERLLELLTAAARPPKPRKKTRVPPAAKRRRLENKLRRATAKQLRRPVRRDE